MKALLSTFPVLVSAKLSCLKLFWCVPLWDLCVGSSAFSNFKFCFRTHLHEAASCLCLITFAWPCYSVVWSSCVEFSHCYFLSFLFFFFFFHYSLVWLIWELWIARGLFSEAAGFTFLCCTCIHGVVVFCFVLLCFVDKQWEKMAWLKSPETAFRASFWWVGNSWPTAPIEESLWYAP